MGSYYHNGVNGEAEQPRLTSSASFKAKKKPAAAISRAFSDADDIITLLHGSDPVRVELTRLENEAEGRAEGSGLGGSRSLESVRQRYKRLNKNVTAWVAAYKKAYERKTSGQSKEDIEKAAQTLYGKSKFTHHDVFERVMCHNPKWELKLNTTTRYTRRADDDSVEESHGSSKRSRTDEDRDPPRDSTPETPVSDASLFTRHIGRDQAKTRAKRKGKEVASQSSSLLPDELREMRITREKEIEAQKEKTKTAMLMLLMGKSELTPQEEALRCRLMAELFGM